MEWKEEVAKTAIGGLLIFVGTQLYKIIKKAAKPIRTGFTNIGKIEILLVDSHYGLEQIRALMHVMPYPVYLMDMDGGLEWVNPAWCELVGFNDPDDAYGNGWMRTVPDEGLEQMRQRNEDFVKHPSNSSGEIIMMHIHSKEKFTAKFRNELLYDEHKKPFKSLGILRDISKLKKT